MKNPLALLLAACLAPAPALAEDWWKDAVFYEIFVRSFADSTEGPLAGDGVGDLAGLIERLDELNDGKPGGDDLGVNALWLMPIAESPSYHGYDVVDYKQIDAEYGTNDDFKRLIEECNRRGIRVVVDLVLNHCSWQHPWFEKASNPEDPHHHWFVWRDSKPDWRENLHMWHDKRMEQTGKYYFGFFWHGMPDLNFDNPFVTLAAYDISRFWIEDMGVHGFRLDAIRHLIERGETLSSTPETIAWLEGYQRYLKSVDPACFTVGEVWGPTEEVKLYLPDALDSAFEFQLADTVLSTINAGDPAPLAEHIERLNEAYDGAPFSTFLSNHDQDRVMSRFGGPSPEAFAKNKLAATLLLTLPGTPFLYYGEEIGMTGVKPDPDLRTPMQWTADPAGSGFTTGTPWRPLNADTPEINVAAQKADRDSLWRHYQSVIALRLESEALRRGETEVIPTGSPHVLAIRRSLPGEEFIVLANFSDQPAREFRVDLGGFNPGQLVRTSVAIGNARPSAGRADGEGRVLGWMPVARIPPREAVVVRVIR